jgi:hypothetical protein
MHISWLNEELYKLQISSSGEELYKLQISILVSLELDVMPVRLHNLALTYRYVVSHPIYGIMKGFQCCRVQGTNTKYYTLHIFLTATLCHKGFIH